jgi:hypothetical protein
MESVERELSTIRDAIEMLDLDPINVKLMDTVEGRGWSEDQIAEADRMYRRFLYLTAKYKETTIVPTSIVDDLWHAHILDTEKYLSDCYTIFGQILHHFPYLGLRGSQDARDLREAFELTERLFFVEFGSTQSDTKHFKSAMSTTSICGGGKCGNSCKGNIDLGLASNRPRLPSKTGRVKFLDDCHA